MTLSSFDDLLAAAVAHPEPQRLLFVFARAGLEADASADQRARFEAGEGGTLTPVMCVDKLPRELPSFIALRDEARQFEQAWDLVFVAAMAGSGPASPTSQEADAHLQRMVDSIKNGRIGSFVAFDAAGLPVRFG